MSYVGSRDFLLDVSAGLIPGYSVVTIQASNTDVDTTEEDVWGTGGSLSYLTSADNFRIAAGGNAADDAAGTGARAVVVKYLDANYAVQTETLATAGASASSSTTGTGIRLLDSYVTLVGSGGENAGAITIEAVSAATTQGTILTGEGNIHNGFYTIPAGKTGFVVGENFSVVKAAGGPGNGTAGVQFYGWIRLYNASSTNNYESWRNVFHVSVLEGGSNPIQLREYTEFPLPEKADIRVSAISDTSNMHVDARLYIVLKDN